MEGGPPRDPTAALWTASLLEDPAAPGMRAIWSPDFVPDALLGLTNHPPTEASLQPPWPVPPTERTYRPPVFRLPTDQRDRHEIVAMSSLHGLVVRARRVGAALQDDVIQFEQPAGFEVATPNLTEGQRPVLHRPRPLDVGRLALSTLGATLDLDAAFRAPPVAAIEVDGKRPFAFSVERWTQKSVWGRDIEVEVQYRGYLYPIGVRAVLVKRTERSVRRGPHGRPMAYLIQRKFLRIVQPVKPYPAPFQAFDGRQWPLAELRMLLGQSPDLVDPLMDPRPEPGQPGVRVAPYGRLWITTTAGAAPTDGLVFWPRTAPRDGAEVAFPMRLVSLNGRAARGRTPFIEVARFV